MSADFGRVTRLAGAGRRRARLAAVGALCAACLLAAGCGRQTVTLTTAERLELGNRSLDLLIRAADSGIDVVACNAIEALVRVAPREAIAPARKALGAASPLVRFAGFVALGELQDRESLPAIREHARSDDQRVRLAAAFAAYRCGADGHVRLLLSTLTDHPDENLRADAAFLLGRLGEPRAADRLRAALRFPANAESNRVRMYLYGALANLGHRDAAHALIRSAQNDIAGADALLLVADLGDPDSAGALRFRLFQPNEEHVENRLIAARGLGRLGDPAGFDLAMRMLAYAPRQIDPDDPDRTMRIRSLAAHALAEIGDPAALDGLRKLAAEPSDARLQVAACYAICRILDVGAGGTERLR